ncbi:MAG TPA: hypothetical protein VJC17_04820 [Candidatus Dojkabacteria bacterium]|nr:hypothetical protein [Candidatus Dojkabacteria bacterium]
MLLYEVASQFIFSFKMLDNKAQELLKKVRDLLKSEGRNLESNIGDEADLMKDYVLEAIKNTKDIQKHLYAEFLPKGKGFTRRIKNLILGKIANVTRNTVERSLIKQQKYNENVALLLEYLFKENQKLCEQVKAIIRKPHEG